MHQRLGKPGAGDRATAASFRPASRPFAPQIQRAQRTGLADLEPQREGARRPVDRPGRMTITAEGASRTPVDQVIQRAIGFEFELDGTRSWREKEQKKGPPIEEKLEKGHLIAPYIGFDVTADETPPGEAGLKGSDVEVIIREIDDRDPNGQKKLVQTLVRAIELLQGLNARRAPTRATKFGGTEKDVFVEGAFDNGTLQATVGMDLSALYKFRSGEMGQEHEQRLAALGPAPGGPLGSMAHDTQAIKAFYLRQYGAASSTVMTLAQGWIDTRMKNLPLDVRRQLAAVVSMIVTIPVTAIASSPVPYPKSAAGALLARTDLATMIQQLPEGAKVFIADRDLWTAMLLGITSAASGEQVGSGSLVFPENSIKEGEETPLLTLTLGEWFGALAPPFPVDKLTKASYPEEHGGKEQGKWLESMGGFGEHMDPALSESAKERPIVEFRKQMRVPLEHLITVCTGIWELVHLSHRKN